MYLRGGNILMRFHQKICDLIEDREDLTLTTVAEKIDVPLQYMSKFKNKEQLVFVIYLNYRMLCQ